MVSVIIATCIFLIGYHLGRSKGKAEGQYLGESQAVIDLRIAALETGSCPICRYTCEADGVILMHDVSNKNYRPRKSGS